MVSEVRESYEERLKYLKLPSLKAHRVKGNLIHETYKMYNDVNNIDKACFFQPALTGITSKY